MTMKSSIKKTNNSNADALSRIPQITALQAKASGSKYFDPDYNLFLQHVIDEISWKTDNIIPQTSGSNKGLLVKEIHAAPRIKIILSKTSGNTITDLTLTPGDIQVTKENHLSVINLVTHENETAPADLETVFQCLIKLKRYAIANNKTILSIAQIGNATNKLKIIQMRKYIFKDTPI